jgi:3-hydroxymyristoyl/3-hydroxydecanoyl-(acyl carrier protein) dehydratase
MIKLPPPIITYPAILNYLPQRPPMVMVDSYYGVFNDEAYTSFYISKENILLEENNFSEMGILDFLAQSGIVQLGNMTIIPEFSKESKIGVICQFKNFKIYATAKVGQTIFGKIKKIFSNSNSASLDVVAFIEEKILMEGTINAMIINNNQNVNK